MDIPDGRGKERDQQIEVVDCLEEQKGVAHGPLVFEAGGAMAVKRDLPADQGTKPVFPDHPRDAQERRLEAVVVPDHQG